MSGEQKKVAIKVIARNKKAWHEYAVLDTWEAGVVLVGTEVKSVRGGKVGFQDAFAHLRDGEVWLVKLHISPYSHGNRENHEPLRKRKLLLHDREIVKISQQIKEKGLTLIPLSLYLKHGLVKVEIGLCRGKKMHDKRHTIEERDTRRDVERALRSRK